MGGIGNSLPDVRVRSLWAGNLKPRPDSGFPKIAPGRPPPPSPPTAFPDPPKAHGDVFVASRKDGARGLCEDSSILGMAWWGSRGWSGHSLGFSWPLPHLTSLFGLRRLTSPRWRNQIVHGINVEILDCDNQRAYDRLFPWFFFFYPQCIEDSL